MTTVSAPAVLKLFGEHAVVYGRLSLGAAIDKYATATAKDTNAGSIRIELKDFNLAKAADRAELKKMYEDYSSMPLLGYIKKGEAYGQMLPYLTIAAAIRERAGIDVSKSVSISSEIPVQKGYASSSACSTAFAASLLYGSGISDTEAIRIARIGDMIMHRSEGAGRIDVSTSYLGGYVSYSASSGARKENIKEEIPIVIIDTGPKKSTAETVGHVAELYREKRDYVEGLFNRINDCSIKGISYLSNGDIKAFGEAMLLNQELLKEIGVSSRGLDSAVELAMKSGAYGAKLSGGGGGGIAIAVANDASALASELKKHGINSEIVHVTLNGAMDKAVF